ncbi:hypothetical protein [Nocardiopsis kunsanensis]|uniref:hypothetical protein n=1 Tax=Nocardiopsis kunsanensis TaxID=141693 RepID=UPI0003485864|nr:hypothetical protein [Nocardiopsis kunsanensis]
MHTSMPYPPLIRLTREHIADLRDQETPACLTWSEDTCQVEVTDPWETTSPDRMIISGHQGLRELTAHYACQGRQANDGDLAGDLSAMAAGWQIDWHGIRAMNLQVHELRRNLATAGVYLSAAPTLAMPATGGLPAMTDYYCLAGSEHTAHVTVTFGFIDPTRITTSGLWEEAEPAADRTLATSSTLTYAATSRLVASTVTQALHHGR